MELGRGIALNGGQQEVVAMARPMDRCGEPGAKQSLLQNSGK
jgi:hypothetical protein